MRTRPVVRVTAGRRLASQRYVAVQNTAMHAGTGQSSKGNDAPGNEDKDTDELVASGPSQRKGGGGGSPSENPIPRRNDGGIMNMIDLPPSDWTKGQRKAHLQQIRARAQSPCWPALSWPTRGPWN